MATKSTRAADEWVHLTDRQKETKAMLLSVIMLASDAMVALAHEPVKDHPLLSVMEALQKRSV